MSPLVLTYEAFFIKVLYQTLHLVIQASFSGASRKNCRCLRAVGKDTKDIRRLVLRLCSSKVFYALDFLLNELSICQAFEVSLFTVFLWGLLKPYVVWGEPLPPFFFFFGRWFAENEICKRSLKILSFIVNAVFKWIMLVPLWSFF